jgi:hypothetical protein
MTHQILRESTGTFDHDAKFTFEITRYNGAKSNRDGYIFKDAKENKIYIMQSSAILQSSYTPKETESRNRLNALKPLKTGDTVIFEGKPHKVTINGDYSDAGSLKPI